MTANGARDSMNETQFQIYKAIAVSVALGFTVVVQALVPYRGTIRDAFKNWKTNFPLGILNVLVMGAICGGCVCTLANAAEVRGVGLANVLGWSLPVRVAASILILDFVAYGWHRANHRFRLLWRFHAVHHSDRIFDVSTAVRFHPGELLISLGIRLLIVLAFGLPVVGLLVFEVLYGFFNFFEHGNVRLPQTMERWLAVIFVTPALHRKHHSVKLQELNRNFSTIFSYWDRIFRSYAPSTSIEDITVGLVHHTGDPYRVTSLLKMPIRSE